MFKKIPMLFIYLLTYLCVSHTQTRLWVEIIKKKYIRDPNL